MMHLQGLLGLIAIPLIAWLLSESRKYIVYKGLIRILAVGMILQFLIALLLTKLPVAEALFLSLNDLVLALEQATLKGTQFVFGFLGGGNTPFETSNPGANFILAFRALPIVLVISALSSLLHHWRILPWLVKGISSMLQRSMNIGGALGLASAANIFMGMVEAPLLVRPYLARMSRAELFALMTTGMATIAGTMLALYASVLGGVIPNALGHILTASLISAPAALMLALIMVPQQQGNTAGEMPESLPYGNSMDAITYGTIEGLKLLANIVAMLIVLIALVSLANQLLGLLPDISGEPLKLQRILGWLLSPLAWLMGIPWHDAQTAGALLGTKIVLNEFIAYLDLAALPAESLSERSRLILIYALCGFANLGSLGIMIGGIGAMVPERRSEIAGLGLKSIISGILATCLTGTVIGIIS
ncbi:MAG: nucleoside:proton symporter [Gammaproteobacteria bacterium]|nr:nucleoside:proton symporter [Gammaproteobacteria bacterium]